MNHCVKLSKQHGKGGQNVFVELVPLLRQRTLLITVARMDEKLKVNVVPIKKKEGEDQALTTPLSLTGSPEELDAEFGNQLVNYVDVYLELASTLAEAKTEMETAAKAARQRVKASQATKPDPAATRKEVPAMPVMTPAEGTPSLFTTEQQAEEPSVQAGREG
jgi:PRTRC genetic system protein E